MSPTAMSSGEQNTEAGRAVLPQVELEILRGRAKRKMRRIDVPVYLIGSAPDCDLVLADSEFPEVHTYIYVTKQGVSVRRLGEGPELLINGAPVQTAQLASGERLSLGNYEFAVHVTPRPHLDFKTEHQNVVAVSLPVESSLPAGVAGVMALLADIRATLRVESGLKLYIEPENTWRPATSVGNMAAHKATA